jgi:anti-sigma factor RsiW
MKDGEREDLGRALGAYHDGELRGLARWRFERRLRRDPTLRHELALLEELGEAVRKAGAGAPGPDLWDRIALRLPAADARRAEVRRASDRRARRAWLVGAPLGAAAAVGLGAVVIVALGQPRRPPEGVVRWMYAGKRSVLVLEDPATPDTTIIWVLDGSQQPAAGGSSGGVA